MLNVKLDSYKREDKRNMFSLILFSCLRLLLVLKVVALFQAMLHQLDYNSLDRFPL